MAEETTIVVPDIGDFKAVEVIEVLVAVGDDIAIEDSLIVLESDKSTMEIPAPRAGVITSMRVKAGDRVSAGYPILQLAVADEAPAGGSGPMDAPESELPTTEPPATEPAAETSKVQSGFKPPPVEPLPLDRPSGSKPHASPGVRKFARELGVDLGQVQGTGPKGRIGREDVQDFVKGVLAVPHATADSTHFALPEPPVIDFGKFGPIETVAIKRIQRIAGASLHRSWLHVPHVTHHDEADITELESFRQSLKGEAEKRGVRLTLLSFLMKAAVAALKQYESFNASLDPSGERLIFKRYYHLGIAVDTPNGLVVPVLRDVDQKGLWTLTEELAGISDKARDGKLSPTEMQGATFTVSSLGGIGGVAFTPIVNAPEVAILGVSRAALKPSWRGGEFVPRLQLPLSLSYDHRVIDGAAAARFSAFLATLLGDIRRLLL